MSSAQFIMVHSWMTSFTALLMADRRTPSELNNKQAINFSKSMSKLIKTKSKSSYLILVRKSH